MSDSDDIKLARTAGFCWGVKRAMDMTLETASKANGSIVHTHGPLIHNPQVIEMLEGKNVFAMDDATTLDHGTVIIRTHGVTPVVRRELKNRGLDISDATCPLVARVQGIIKKHANHGYHTIIIGDKGHAEIIGLAGYTQGRGHVIGSLDEIDELPPMEKVCIVAQTTCDVSRYEKVADALKARYPSAVIADTICDATRERQEEVLDMAKDIDLMVVVGGRNSANTARLAQLSRDSGAKTILIESEEDIDPDEIINSGRIGLTAGASTPTWMIERVLDRVRRIVDEKQNKTSRWQSVIEGLVISKVSVAVGSALMVLANSTLAGFEFGWTTAFIAAAYLFSMHALNQLSDAQTFDHNEPEKTRFYQKHKRLIELTAFTVSLMSIVAAMTIGWQVAWVYLGAVALGLGYTVKLFPRNRFVKIERLKDIPASKDIFVGVAWVVVTVIIPALAVSADIFSPPVLVACALTFGLVYIRTVVSDIRDIHGDKLVGRETIPILIGKEQTKVFLAFLTVGLAILLVTASALGWVTSFGYFLLVLVGYTALYLGLYHRRIIARGFRFDLTLDGVFYMAGIMAIVWGIL